MIHFDTIHFNTIQYNILLPIHCIGGRDNFAPAFLSPPHTPVVLLQYKPYGARTYTAPITMLNPPHPNIASLPLPFASAFSTGMLNEYSLSCTLAANNTTKEWLDMEISIFSFPTSFAGLYHF